MKHLYIFLALLLLPAATASSSAEGPGDEEYLVYSAVIEDLFGDRGAEVNVSDSTVWLSIVDDSRFAGSPPFGEALLNETLENLKAKGGVRWPLERRFDPGVDYRLVNERDDPLATGILGFSRVGFGGDQALLLVEESAYWYVSEGSFVLLELAEEGWTVVGRELAYLGE